MAFLGNVFIDATDHTKSGYADRRGFSDDSGWSNNGNIHSQLSATESTNIFGSGVYGTPYDGVRVEAFYGFQYGGTDQWEVVLKLKDYDSNLEIKKYPGFACVVNAEQPDVILRLSELYDYSYSNYVATYRWRGNIKKALNNKSVGGGWQSGFFTELVFTDEEPPSVTEVIVDLDLGYQAGDRKDNFNIVGPDVTDVNFLSIRPRIKNAYVGASTSTTNPFLDYLEPNLGPTLVKVEGAKVFFNIGIPISHGTDSNGSYIEFNDWLWGTGFPINQGYSNHMNSVIWEGLEITDKTGWALNLRTVTSDPQGVLVTPQGASPASRYTTLRLYYVNTTGVNYSSPSAGLFSREIFLEWPEGLTLHNRRFHVQVGGQSVFGNRFTVTNRKNTSPYKILDYEFPRGMILVKPLGAQRDSDYYNIILGFQAVSSNSFSELAQVRINGYAGEDSVTSTTPSSYSPAATYSQENPRNVANIAPYGDPIIWRFRNPSIGSPVSITTTTDGCTVEGHSAIAATGKKSTSVGAIQQIVPNTQGERYRVQHVFDYGSGNGTRIFTLEGRILDTAKSNTVQVIQGSSQGQQTSGGNSGIELVGDEGLRLHFKIPWSGSSSDLDKIAGMFVEVTALPQSVNGGTVINKAGIIKRNATGSNFYHHDSAIFVPNGTSSTWSVVATITIINSDIPYQRSHSVTWSGTWKPEYSVEVLSPEGGTRLDRDTQPLRWAGSGHGLISNTIGTSTSNVRQPSGTQTYYYINAGPYGTQVTGTDDYRWTWESYQSNTHKNLRIYWEGVNVYTGNFSNSEVSTRTHISAGGNTYYRGSSSPVVSLGNGDHYRIYRIGPVTTTTETFGSGQISMPSFNYNTKDDYAWVQNETAGFVKISMDYTAGDHADVIKGPTDWTGPGALQSQSVPYYLAAFKITGDD